MNMNLPAIIIATGLVLSAGIGAVSHRYSYFSVREEPWEEIIFDQWTGKSQRIQHGIRAER
jgi:hypothetical protein